MHGFSSALAGFGPAEFVYGARMTKDIDPMSAEWSDALHAAIMAIVGHINRPEPDARILSDAGIALEPWLMPALSRIGLNGPLSVVELGHLLGKDHSSVSRQVTKLETLGLVERNPSDEDKRVKLLAPSALGVTMLRRIRQARRQAMAQWFKSWSEKDRTTLLRLMNRMIDQAGQ